MCLKTRFLEVTFSDHYPKFYRKWAPRMKRQLLIEFVESSLTTYISNNLHYLNLPYMLCLFGIIVEFCFAFKKVAKIHILWTSKSLFSFSVFIFSQFSETCLEPYQTFKMVFFVKIVNDWKQLTNLFLFSCNFFILFSK